MADLQTQPAPIDAGTPDDADEDKNSTRGKLKSMLQKIREGDIPGAKQDVDDVIQDKVVNPLYKAGYENAGPALGAGLSAGIEYAVPDTPAQAALMAAGPLAKGVGVVGKLGKVASMAGKEEQAASALSRVGNAIPVETLEKTLSPDKLAEIGKDLNLYGYHNLEGPAGNLITTVGKDAPGADRLMALGKAAKDAEEAAAPSLKYSEDAVQAVNAPKGPVAPKGPQGEAADYFAKNDIDIRGKTGKQVLDELQAKRKQQASDAMNLLYNKVSKKVMNNRDDQ